jgi:hypothetical protein
MAHKELKFNEDARAALERGVNIRGEPPDDPEGRRSRGHSLDEELEQFLNQKGRYANGWAPLGEATSDVFVRYDQIVEVRKNLSP